MIASRAPAFRSAVVLGIAAALLKICCEAQSFASHPTKPEFVPPSDALVAGFRETETHRPDPPRVAVSHFSGMGEDGEFWLHVDPEGHVTEIRAGIGTPEERVDEVCHTVRDLRYKPFLRDGKPEDAWVQEKISFRSLETIPAKRIEFPKFTLSKAVTVQLERSMCYGSCPAYSVASRGDGLVSYEGGSYVSIAGKQTAQIPVADVAALLDRFQDANFLALDGSYHASVTDNPYYTLTLKLPGKSKSVIDYVGEWVGMPDAVTSLEKAVDRTADSARWVSSSPGTVAAMKAAGIAIPSREASDILRTAVGAGDLETVGSLLQAHVELNPTPSYGTSATSHFYRPFGASLLTVAVQSRDARTRLEMLRTLLALPEIAKDAAGKQEALAQAAESGQADLARLLIAAGADPAARFAGRYQLQSNDQPTETYLMLAATSGVWEMIDDALARPHDFHAVDSDNHTALDRLVRDAPQHENLRPLIHHFLAAGAEPAEFDRILRDAGRPTSIPVPTPPQL